MAKAEKTFTSSLRVKIMFPVVPILIIASVIALPYLYISRYKALLNERINVAKEITEAAEGV
ncbi:hypothetical protein MNL76_09650 [Fervidobacterium riparium]|uniref:Uncharacterized protein n=1 Tax=Fervidobacterium gondwanense DSM 13020 TaxID=1121883 RepID=A0A1M7S8Q9_FERGO|nr:hypothetical protein [Fervidobacterium gondwanense]UXF00979.1 hypothetical protein IB67_05325 [Fervidobacterium riparium]SHN54871.1 hypothetical protein SAMN02745226_00666 [Fervidobacterium gondwanense DSM 13020]